MNKERLMKILHKVNCEIICQLAHIILDTNPEIRIIKPPQLGLIMMRARETVENQPFNLGEVLVTECTVALGETTGWGCCLGNDPDRAYHLAVVDLALNLGIDPGGKIEATLMAEEKRVTQEKKAEFVNIARSKVQFEILGG